MKKLLIFVCVLLFISVSVFASPAAINFENLPKDEKFEKLFLDFGNFYNSIKYPDFKNKDTKKDALKAANSLYTYLQNKNKANYDECLLALLTGRCLYIFDDVEFEMLV